MIIVDTSGLLAAFDTSESDHAACADVLEGNNAPYVMSPLVLAEIDYLVTRRLGIDAELAVLDDIRTGQYTLAALDADDYALALDVVKLYRDLEIGIADASNVVLAQRYRTNRLLTLDEHYRAIRPLDESDAFRMLPADS